MDQIATTTEIDAMTIAQLQLYVALRKGQCDVGPFGNPFAEQCVDYRYTICTIGNAAYGVRDSGACGQYSEVTDPNEGLAMDARLAAIALTLGLLGPKVLDYIKQNPEDVPIIETFAQAAARGRAFEGSVLRAISAAKNTITFTSPGGVKFIPDSLFNGILEIKDVLNVVSTAQLRAEAGLAQLQNVPFNLVVGVRNLSISPSVEQLVRQTGGTIVRFDPVTVSFLPWP